MRAEYMIILAASRGVVDAQLRDMGVPPPAFLRRARIVTPEMGLGSIKGMTGAIWCAVEPHPYSVITLSEVAAITRSQQIPTLAELVARHLAWKVYHDAG